MALFGVGVAGLLFGIGLLMSGMTDPMKVQNFLDLFGVWDPSLAFVMGGAIAVALPGFRLVQAREKPLFAPTFRMPTRTDIDRRLILGAAVFGVGWAIGGLCPGPALAILPGGAVEALVFFPAMLAGMMLAKGRGGAVAAGAREPSP